MKGPKVYTKTGDKGSTSLVGGSRVPKSHQRLEAYGTVDELNVNIGSLRDEISDDLVFNELIDIQENLFTMGSLLAYDGSKEIALPELRNTEVEKLEQAMDRMEEVLAPLRNFILPGGHAAVSKSHICRVVCRRAERQVIRLSEMLEVNEMHIKYLNRLSDYFFVLSRYQAHINKAVETPWISRKD